MVGNALEDPLARVGREVFLDLGTWGATGLAEGDGFYLGLGFVAVQTRIAGMTRNFNHPMETRSQLFNSPHIRIQARL